MTLQSDTIANTIAGRLDLLRQNESLRAQLAKCAAARTGLERRVMELSAAIEHLVQDRDGEDT